MHISTIPSNFIVNATFQSNGIMQSDFLFRALRIKNDASKEIKIEKISFQLKVQGRMVKEVSYYNEALEILISAFPNRVKHLGKLFLGTDMFWDCNCLSNSSVLQPSEETGVFNEFFLVVNSSAIDELTVIITYTQNDEKKFDEITIPVIRYKSKNNYIFPVKGTWQINGNYDCICAHRGHYSMEFAFDIAQLNKDALIVYKEKMENEDHSAYGKEILAIAGGEVVDCFNDFTKTIKFSMDPVERDKVWKERKELIEQFGFIPQQCGNYVVLKHDNDEYSFYGHMIHQNVIVKKGDTVKQGQVVGRLGNTGFSGGPHLHFQLMDGPDFLTARGLPCCFTNIRDAFGNELSLISEEYTIVRAE